MISGDFVPLLMAGLLCKQKRKLVPIVVPHQCAAAALAQRAAEAAAAPVAWGWEGPRPSVEVAHRAGSRFSGLPSISRFSALGPPGLLGPSVPGDPELPI